MNKEDYLNQLVQTYEKPEFILDDPIQFPHRFKDKLDQEVMALIASSLAYGRRPKILETNEKILKIMNNKPYEFALNYDLKSDNKKLEDITHRYTKGKDISLLIYCIGNALQEYKSLEYLFMTGFNKDDKNIKQALIKLL